MLVGGGAVHEIRRAQKLEIVYTIRYCSGNYSNPGHKLSIRPTFPISWSDRTDPAGPSLRESVEENEEKVAL
jgi:hypothetical protein